MTSRDFAYWLQGFFELSGTNQLTPEQVVLIKAHLNLVFIHEIDPSHEPPEGVPVEVHQDMLNAAHAAATQPQAQAAPVRPNRPGGGLARC